MEHAKSICDDAQRQRNQSGVPAKGKTPTVLDLKWNRPTSELPASSTLLSSTTKSKSVSLDSKTITELNYPVENTVATPTQKGTSAIKVSFLVGNFI